MFFLKSISTHVFLKAEKAIFLLTLLYLTKLPMKSVLSLNAQLGIDGLFEEAVDAPIRFGVDPSDFHPFLLDLVNLFHGTH